MIGWIMNWRGCGRKRSCPVLEYWPYIYLEGLRKTTNNLSIADLRARIRTMDLPNTKQESYLLYCEVRYTKWSRTHLKSEGFWRWCVIICNSVFWYFSIVYISIKLRFGSWIFFRLQIKKEGQKPQLLGPLVKLASDLVQVWGCSWELMRTYCDFRLICVSNPSPRSMHILLDGRAL
jgi:hypothetical protein